MARQGYVQGSSARKVAVRPENTERELRVVKKKAFHETVEQTPVNASRYHLGHIVMLAMVLLVIGGVVTGYIWLNSDIIKYQKECANLQRQYESLKTSNDLYEDRIVNSVDKEEIERIAVCDLGMKLAQEGQIVVYSGEIEDYVKQYSDIPY